MNDYYFVRVFITGNIVILLGVIAIVTNAPDDQDLEQKHHCEMVALFNATGGKYGWPDYNNTAHMCPEVQHETQL